MYLFDMIDGININKEGYVFCLNIGFIFYVNVVVNVMCLYLDIIFYVLLLNSLFRCEYIE